ncbi:MAG: hypothetical protein AAFX03_12330 [Pseudomonadota bacterium]
MNDLRFSDLAFPIALLAVLTGGLILVIDPEPRLAHQIAMFAPLGALAAMEAARHSKLALCGTLAEWRFAKATLAGASLVLVVGLALVAADVGGLLEDPERETRRRAMGALLGLMIMAYGNALPKQLSVIKQTECSPAATQAKNRAVGWITALAGLAYAGVWLTLPVAQADRIGFWVWPAAAVFLSVWMLLRRRRAAA